MSFCFSYGKQVKINKKSTHKICKIYNIALDNALYKLIWAHQVYNLH